MSRKAVSAKFVLPWGAELALLAAPLSISHL